jgi:hypothetical protein
VRGKFGPPGWQDDADMHLVQVPIVLGRGVRVWNGLEALEENYEIETVSVPSGVTHLTFTQKTS